MFCHHSSFILRLSLDVYIGRALVKDQRKCFIQIYPVESISLVEALAYISIGEKLPTVTWVSLDRFTFEKPTHLG